MVELSGMPASIRNVGIRTRLERKSPSPKSRRDKLVALLLFLNDARKMMEPTKTAEIIEAVRAIINDCCGIIQAVALYSNPPPSILPNKKGGLMGAPRG